MPHASATRSSPGRTSKAIADGPTRSSTTCARPCDEHGLDAHIRFGHQVARARTGRPTTRCWTVTRASAPTARPSSSRARFLFSGTGYYDYERGVHAGVRGPRGLRRARSSIRSSGPKTSTTRASGSWSSAAARPRSRSCPAMAGTAAHVTMLQRSPSYMFSLPAEDPIANTLQPGHRARARPTGSLGARTSSCSAASTSSARKRPALVRRLLHGRRAPPAAQGLRRRHALQPDVRPVGPAAVPGPRRRPLRGHRRGRRVGRHRPIDRFVPDGIRLQSGRVLEADIVVTATGLNMQPLGGIEPHRRRRGGRPAEHHRLQGHDALRRAELRLRDRLHERVVDAEGATSSASTCVACSAHMDATASDLVVPVLPASGQQREPSSTSARATCSAASTVSRAPGRPARGRWRWPTSATSSGCATAASRGPTWNSASWRRR